MLLLSLLLPANIPCSNHQLHQGIISELKYKVTFSSGYFSFHA